MRPLISEVTTAVSPECLVERLSGETGVTLLRSALFDSPQARYSFVVARPFLTLRAFGSRCELNDGGGTRLQFGDPWHILDGLMARYELLDEMDLPFPLGGCFGYWGYDLKNFVEPRLTRRAENDLELPDCCVGFYDSLVVFDHRIEKSWIVSTGLHADGTRDASDARRRLTWWNDLLGDDCASHLEQTSVPLAPASCGGEGGRTQTEGEFRQGAREPVSVKSNLTRDAFIAAVERAQRYIRAGDIYQVNLAQRLEAPAVFNAWEFHRRLSAVSPAPFSAYLDCGDFQISSSSPEMFLRLSGSHSQTRPIKGTRPRSSDPTRDAQLTYELQTSGKEMSELVMITDLLRNDLGRVCEYGSVQVPELVRLERYPQVQHLVSTVEGRLRPDVTHFAAFARCFPGGSITGAPKIRAMEIIDELEPVTRGPYTGCLGYLGFNRESQLNIVIRTAVCRGEKIYFHVGAGIVADSAAEAEYDETLAKGAGFMAALGGLNLCRLESARNPDSEQHR
jgi:para-aminobenzoate synthetase component 1